MAEPAAMIKPILCFRLPEPHTSRRLTTLSDLAPGKTVNYS
jgi:hypothetical protein